MGLGAEVEAALQIDVANKAAPKSPQNVMSRYCLEFSALNPAVRTAHHNSVWVRATLRPNFSIVMVYGGEDVKASDEGEFDVSLQRLQNALRGPRIRITNLT
jgi:hypothetical protein